MHRKLPAATALLAILLLAGAAGAANPGKSEAIVHSLLSQDLPQIPGKEVSMLTVEYLPGGASLPHRHDAEVFVYVLEGSVIMQVDGQKAVTLGPGGTFHEGPNDVHRQSRNASATQPAKFLVFMIKDKDKPATRPVAAAK
jgi:quercetin dioxygenase-like cupin family protein